MKLNHPVPKVNTPKAYSLSDRRYAKRIPIRYRIEYFEEKGARIVTGEGVLKDLSKTGCMILGATTSSLGSRLTLLLDVEDGQGPMRLTDVLVSWIAKDSFALKFPMLSPEQRKRLQDVVLKNIGLSYFDDRRAAFRIVSPSMLMPGGNHGF
ncbi:MAG: PilZ domain-containing protein [Nitrospiraceae bacterium]